MSDAFTDPHRPRRRHRRHGLGRTPLPVAIGIALAVLALVLLLGAFLLRGQNPAAGLPSTGQVPARPGDDPAAFAAVVYNENDLLSLDLARFYAGRRGIPEDRLVALRCSGEEEISREEYDATIAGPLRQVFDERRWWTRSPDRTAPPADPADHRPASTVFANRIRFLVLMRGVPLKIRPQPGYPGDFSPERQPPPVAGQNAAAVDSELAVLGLFTRGISGVVGNPYFRAYSRIQEANLPGIMLVGRLDGPSAVLVRRMIEDSLYAEQNGLWGRAYVDARGLPPNSDLAQGDTWFERAAADLGPRVLPTVLDRRPAMFSAPYPMTEAAVYLGWYSEQPAGPFTREDFKFQRGAVAYHLHSWSGVTVRDPARHWVAPLLARGAAATLGCVYEPYLGLTPHPDVLSARLLDGFTFGEAAYMASPGLSWMTTVVGDPLYRPGRVWQQLAFGSRDADLPPPDGPVATEGRAYLRGVNVWRQRGPKDGAAELERSGRTLRSGRVFEGLGLLQAAAGDRTRARASFEQAGKFYADARDKVRVTLHLARLLTDAGQKEPAAEVLRKAAGRLDAAGPAAAALREMQAELAPSPAPAR